MPIRLQLPGGPAIICSGRSERAGKPDARPECLEKPSAGLYASRS